MTLINNLWELLRSPDFTNVKLGITIYRGNWREFKKLDPTIKGYIDFVVKHYGKDGTNYRWGIYDCSENQITKLPDYVELLPLNTLFCFENRLTELPEYPNLKELRCSDSHLTKLPEYPSLELLNCFNNQLTELPNYPNLKELSCHGNQLKALPAYPLLEELSCFWNHQLIELPKYPNLKKLYCDDKLQIWYNKTYKTNFV